MTYGCGKSDSAILAGKPTNKAEQSAAESVERRVEAKWNSGQQSAYRAQDRESVSQALDRIRQVARHRKKEKFTALFHHITVQLLREAFFELKENAAPGVDGLRWGEYEADLEHRLEDLHARLQRGAYRALPGRRGYIPKSDGRLRPLAVAALVGSLKKLPPHRLYAAIGPGTALTPKPVPRRDLRNASGLQGTTQRRRSARRAAASRLRLMAAAVR
jgi:hypothetical protein